MLMHFVQRERLERKYAHTKRFEELELPATIRKTGTELLEKNRRDAPPTEYQYNGMTRYDSVNATSVSRNVNLVILEMANLN